MPKANLKLRCSRCGGKDTLSAPLITSYSGVKFTIRLCRTCVPLALQLALDSVCLERSSKDIIQSLINYE